MHIYIFNRALLVTYHVIKILSTKRLTGDRKIFQDMAKEIFDYLCGLWDSLFMAWASSGAPGDSIHRAHYALKILRILCVRGYKTPHESESVKKFILTVMQRAKETLEISEFFLIEGTSQYLPSVYLRSVFNAFFLYVRVNPTRYVYFIGEAHNYHVESSG